MRWEMSITMPCFYRVFWFDSELLLSKTETLCKCIRLLHRSFGCFIFLLLSFLFFILEVFSPAVCVYVYLFFLGYYDSNMIFKYLEIHKVPHFHLFASHYNLRLSTFSVSNWYSTFIVMWHAIVLMLSDFGMCQNESETIALACGVALLCSTLTHTLSCVSVWNLFWFFCFLCLFFGRFFYEK